MIGRVLGFALIAAASAAVGQPSAFDAARAAGNVGERYDGYMGVAAAISAQVRSQVASINVRRRALYSDLAARRHASPQEVGITAGCQLLARVGVGQAYMLSDGVWRRRAAGQPAPVPDYCR
jgi:uncharacterized protein YdbL (DUF1318 family)